MQEFENVRNEIPTYVIDRLESEWRVMQAPDSELKTGPQTVPPQNTASATSDNIGSPDK